MPLGKQEKSQFSDVELAAFIRSVQQKKHGWFIKRQLQVKIKIENTLYSDEYDMGIYTIGFRIVGTNG